MFGRVSERDWVLLELEVSSSRRAVDTETKALKAVTLFLLHTMKLLIKKTFLYIFLNTVNRTSMYTTVLAFA